MTKLTLEQTCPARHCTHGPHLRNNTLRPLHDDQILTSVHLNLCRIASLSADEMVRREREAETVECIKGEERDLRTEVASRRSSIPQRK